MKFKSLSAKQVLSRFNFIALVVSVLASLSPTTEKDPPGNNSFNEQFSGGKFCITPYYYQHLIIRLYQKLRILSNPQITPRPGK